MSTLDAGEQGERDWLVVTERRPAGETNIVVRAASMVIVDGALVFRTPTGELSYAFGPSGWLEVSRA